MKRLILTTPITSGNLVAVRDRARMVGEAFGLGKIDCTRFITAVSELARNAAQHAGEGEVSFLFELGEPPAQAQYIVAQVADRGPGIADVAAALAGRTRSANGHPCKGLMSCKRLADRFAVELPVEGGTVVTVEMTPSRGARRLGADDMDALVEQVTGRKLRSPIDEVEEQNREMLQVLQALRERQGELERADERKNQFVATLAHELRNPLNTLQMTLHVMRLKPNLQGQELAAHLAVMSRQAQQLNQLVNDLLDVARVSQGKVELLKRPTNVNELVSQALEMTGAAIQDKHHEVRVALSSEPLWVNVDAGRLKQVLSNLVHNAARYSPAHGRIEVRVAREEANAVVEVADRGMGISAELLPLVFGLFVQGPHVRHGESAGLGVGLSLVQRLVHDHGGTVAAASAGAGLGSRFTVTLPLCEREVVTELPAPAQVERRRAAGE